MGSQFRGKENNGAFVSVSFFSDLGTDGINPLISIEAAAPSCTKGALISSHGPTSGAKFGVRVPSKCSRRKVLLMGAQHSWTV